MTSSMGLGIDLEDIVNTALKLGASWADVRFQEYRYEYIVVENGVLKTYSTSFSRGIGVRVLVNGYQGFASTSRLDSDSIIETVKHAISIARSSSRRGVRIELEEVKPTRSKVSSGFKVDPFMVDPEVKAKLLLELNKTATSIDGVRAATTSMGLQFDRRVYVSSDGGFIDLTVRLVGLSHQSIAGEAGVMERVHDSRSRVAGYEFIEKYDWEGLVREVSELAVKASRAKTPPPGSYTVILSPEVVGLLLHEAFGHASEGDSVYSGASVLAGRLGERVASRHVTIIDEGVVEGGYYHPYDDEGVRKEKTIVVEEGVLKNYLTSREIAWRLGLKPTGNARAQDYENIPLVRQTNYYMAPGDYSFDELLEDVEKGLYVTGKGATGGEVNPGTGTFTFGVGVSWIIDRGELKEIVRGVSLSGMILETLMEVDAVGKDLEIRTGVFGGCGKHGQMVRVGFGGPTVRVRRITVGGR